MKHEQSRSPDTNRSIGLADYDGFDCSDIVDCSNGVDGVTREVEVNGTDYGRVTGRQDAVDLNGIRAFVQRQLL